MSEVSPYHETESLKMCPGDEGVPDAKFYKTSKIGKNMIPSAIS